MAQKTEQSFVKWFCFGVGILLVILLICLVIHQIEEFEQQNDPQLDRLRNIFREFFYQDKAWRQPLVMLNHRDMVKEVNIYKGRKSYTLNKHKIYLCLKDGNGKYYSENMLIYVLAHEYAHCLAKSIGHTEEFHEIFEALLVEMTDGGYYDPSQEIIMDYCQHNDDS
jgi:hypothetical protein